MAIPSKKAIEELGLLPYDVIDYLQTPEDRAGYLDVWLEESPEDIRGLSRAIGDIARAKGMTEVAAAAGLNRESLYRALSEKGNPSLATVMKVLIALGIRLRAEVVSPESLDPPTVK
ncbi:MAG: putative addiction module antidote protein [Trueperaceae bacterium]|nr:putative addiction module antidote protein [Trueperaceae bacterium]